jgi:hypothetical protein
VYSPCPKFRRPELNTEGSGDDAAAIALHALLEDNAVKYGYTQGAVQPVPLEFSHKVRFVMGWPKLLL